LRTDYLQMMSHLFGSNGFNRLMKEGTVYEQVTFDYPDVSRASASATVYTGTYPAWHGITSNMLFDRADRSVKPVFYDQQQLGNFTLQTLSPKALLVSTIGDELKSATLGKALVYSIATEADIAIISDGHAGDAAFWLDDDNGKWATTTYYRNLPPYITDFNINNGLDVRIDTMKWNPLLKVKDYTGIPYDTPDFLFGYTFAKDGKDKYRNFKHTPLVNNEITRIAEELIVKGQLGKDGIPDLLNIGYYGGNYPEHTTQEYGAELQDTYIRLDKNIESLLSYIDKNVGLQNSLIFITSTGYTKAEGRPHGIYGVPSGEFFPKRSTALLNYYLMALYGHEDWVLGYNNGEIYLDRELIEKKGLDRDEFLVKSAEFLAQMEGVQDVITSRQILHGDLSCVAALRRKYHRKLSGDLVLTIQPGWEVVYEDKSDSHEYVHYNAVPATLIFFGKNITPAHIARPVSATQIAPTVSRAVRIRAPSASSSLALPEIK
ncbi:MAG: alkaline phosphatase family protein, partial [Bacteroidales bacterium]